MVLLVVHLQPVVGHVEGELPGHFPGDHLGLEPRLVGQVGAQDQEHGEPGADQGEGDHHGGAERGPGPYRPHSASSRYPAPRTVRMAAAPSLRRSALTYTSTMFGSPS